MPKATLSLCIPAYNAAWCLPRLLASATAPGMPFDEILVYDDASTDDTAAVARAYGATVVRGETNRGCAAGKRALAAAATSDWLHFHDADDDLLPAFAPVARRWMARADAPDVLLLGYEYRDRESDQLLAVFRYSDERLSADPVGYAIETQLVNFGLYRRRRFLEAGGYDMDPAVLYNEDVAMHLRLALGGLSFRAEIEPVGIIYHVRSSMSSANRGRCAVAQYHVLRKASERVEPRHQAPLCERLWAVAGVAAAASEWDAARASVELAARLGAARPASGSRAFRMLSSLGAYRAVWVREMAIRALKPQLRA